MRSLWLSLRPIETVDVRREGDTEKRLDRITLSTFTPSPTLPFLVG